ncbi:uncharacterized protein JCM6883_006822 [Sporobolomyces salmoneus]|uniref:uncharacterized protein n=1 Tax=Sporobolomyces salmoneus TaxID=183962 RepID=UPI00317C864A
MRQSTTLVSLSAILFGAMSVSAQTATTISDTMNQLVVNIPQDCLTTCTPWQQSYQQCPIASDTTPDYSTCTCAAEFVTNYNACTGCMVNSFNAVGDTVDAQTATQAPTDLANYCAAAGISESSSTSSLISTTSTSLSSTSTDPAVVTSTSSSDSSMSTSSSVSSSSTASGVVGGVGGPASAGGPFPSQTKQPSAFTNGAGAVKLSGGVVVGLFCAMMMI